MEITLLGRLESALLRETAKIYWQPTIAVANIGYYGGLFREKRKEVFDLAATFCSISKRVVVPEVDWNLPKLNPQETNAGTRLIKELAVEHGNISGRREWNDDIKLFAKVLLIGQAFSDQSIKRLCDIGQNKSEDQETDEEDGAVNQFAHHHLCRILSQLDAASFRKSWLICLEEERQILLEIARFVIGNNLPSPVDLPDLERGLIEPASFAHGLLNYSPADAQSLIAVRADKNVRDYAAAVQQAFGAGNANEVERSLLKALEEAQGYAKRSAAAINVFEITSWACKPLDLLSAIGTGLSVFGLGVDVAKRWMERKHKKDMWYGISSAMRQISIDDFLKRKNNQR